MVPALRKKTKTCLQERDRNSGVFTKDQLKKFHLTLGFLLNRVFVEKVDPPEFSVMAGEDFDMAFSHPVHSYAYPFGRKTSQVLDGNFCEYFMFVSYLVDKLEIHIPYTFALRGFGERLGHDFVQRYEVFEWNAGG
jgi:hypothetical protein